jgi:tetratricopeptide (TPR) repeat protein
MSNDKQLYQNSPHLAPRSMPALRCIELVVLIIVVVTYGWATYQRNLLWKDDFILWSDVVKKSPLKARVHLNMGVVLYRKGAYTQAIAEFKENIRLDPDNPEANYYLGVAYQRIGLYDLAIKEYNNLLSITKKYPKAIYCIPLNFHYFVEAHNNLGVCYFMKGDIDKAIEEFRSALRLNPHHADALHNLGIMIKKGEQIKPAPLSP